MMKRTSLSLVLLFVFLTAFAQSRTGYICRLGLTYEISQSNNWGKNKPVIKTVIPYTPAEQAGIQANDVIEAIDGVSTTTITVDEIDQLLNPVDKSDVILTISNLSTPSKQVLVKKECKRSNAITEDQLASAFSMYSLETTYDQDFTCPFKTIVTPDTVNFGRFKTFAFAAIDENNAKLESQINEAIERELTKKGLTVDATHPDMLVQTFYFFDKNPNYKGPNKVVVEKKPTYRYNFAHSKMERFPFLNSASAESEAEYLLQFGIRLIDQREVPGRVLWESEANELMEDSYRLDQYAAVHIPLMLMQYPYVKYGRNVPFKVSKKSYNYTGINYDIDHLDQVIDVNRNSPAYAAGIRPKDVIMKIDRHKMDRSADEFSTAYKKFITHTMSYRDPNTTFTDANGFDLCMFWDPLQYTQVSDAIQNNDYLTGFSYLYNFAPYINPSGNNACTFNVKRGKNKFEVIIRPTIRSEATVAIK